jgi:hypothetical protein
MNVGGTNTHDARRYDRRHSASGGRRRPTPAWTSKNWIWTLAGSYRVQATPESDFDVLAARAC